MCDFPVLSPRRVISVRDNFDPALKEFLRKKVKLDPNPKGADDVPEITPRTPKTRNPDGSYKRTSDDIVVDRRRAFELRHMQEAKRKKKASEKDWKSRTQFQDWKYKQSLKKIEPHRIQKDRHVIEDIIQERNDYFIGSLAAKRVSARTCMSQTRELPPEMRAVGQATKRNFWA